MPLETVSTLCTMNTGPRVSAEIRRGARAPGKVLLRLGCLHHYHLPFEHLSSQRERTRDLCLGSHFDVGHSLGLRCVAVVDDANVQHRPRLAEEFEHVALPRLGRQVVCKHSAGVSVQGRRTRAELSCIISRLLYGGTTQTWRQHDARQVSGQADVWRIENLHVHKRRQKRAVRC